MRDFVIVLIIFGSIPFILVRPHVGVLMSTWITYMAPQKLGWGFAFDLPVAMVIGSVTIGAWLLSREPKQIPWAGISVLLLIYMIWTNITTVFSLVPEEATTASIQFDKVILLAFLTMIMMRTEKRILALIWVMAGSIAFYSAKGGVFGLLNNLQFKVFGPPGGFYEDNNALAMATVVALPMIYYLSTRVTRRLLRWAIWLVIGLSLISVIGSYSRGAFLGLLALGLVWGWRSKRRVVFGCVAAIIIVGTALTVPTKWVERIYTIEAYQEDGSAMGRLQAMQFGWGVAKAYPIMGGGFGVYGDNRTYAALGPGSGKARAAHNIYFQVLGTQGFVGFALFIALAIAGLRTNSWVRKRAKSRPDLKNEFVLADICWLSIIAYGATGMFQNAANWDLPYTILAISLLNNLRVKELLSEENSKNVYAAGGTIRRFSHTTGNNPNELPSSPRIHS
jgi:probable O-glycosylation ligase (exosortase A-associated)